MVDIDKGREFAFKVERVARALGTKEYDHDTRRDVYSDNKIRVASEFRTSCRSGSVPVSYATVTLSDRTVVFSYFYGNSAHAARLDEWHPGKWEAYFDDLFAKCEVREREIAVEKAAKQREKEEKEYRRKFGPVDDSHIFG